MSWTVEHIESWSPEELASKAERFLNEDAKLSPDLLHHISFTTEKDNRCVKHHAWITYWR